jgi:hypothetical protein
MLFMPEVGEKLAATPLRDLANLVIVIFFFAGLVYGRLHWLTTRKFWASLSWALLSPLAGFPSSSSLPLFS